MRDVHPAESLYVLLSNIHLSIAPAVEARRVSKGEAVEGKEITAIKMPKVRRKAEKTKRERENPLSPVLTLPGV